MDKGDGAGCMGGVLPEMTRRSLEDASACGNMAAHKGGRFAGNGGVARAAIAGDEASEPMGEADSGGEKLDLAIAAATKRGAAAASTDGCGRAASATARALSAEAWTP